MKYISQRLRAATVAVLAGMVFTAVVPAKAQLINGSFIKGANLPWLDGAYSDYLGIDPHHPGWGIWYNSAHMNQYLADMHNMGITVVRLWLNQDDQGCTIDGNGYVTGVTSTYWANLDNTVALAGNNGIKLYLTLNNGRADWLYTNAMANAYKTNCLIPMINRYLGNNNVFAIDLMNEIDGVVGGPDGNYGAGPTWAQAQAYITNFVAAIHSADPGRLVSCSTGWHAWYNLSYFRGLGLDFYDYHRYADAGDLPAASTLGMDKPILIGEAGQYTAIWDDSIQNTCTLNLLNNAYNGAYAGVLVWCYQYPGCSDYHSMVNINGTWRPLCYTIRNFGMTVSGALVWDSDPATPGAQDGGGVWSLTATNWWTGSSNVAWPLSTPVNTTFGAAAGAAGTIALGANLTASNLTFSAAGSGDYTIAGGGYALTLAGTPEIYVTNNLSPTISAPLAGNGFLKTGTGVLTLSGANTYTGTAAVNGGTLVLSGNNPSAAAGSSVAAGATLRLANSGGLMGPLTLKSGSTLQLRADGTTTFVPSGIALETASDTLNFDVDRLTPGVTSRTLRLAGTLAFGNSSDQTINVTGNSAYMLRLGDITATAATHSPYLNININTLPASAGLYIASFTAGDRGNYLNLKGGGRIIISGNLSNTSTGSTILYVKDGTTATLQGASVKVNTGDAYSYFVENGTLVVDNSSALINNTTGAGVNQSWFVLGAQDNAAPNADSAAVYLGGASFLSGGITVGASVTNYVADGGAAFPNTGMFIIGGQNTSGVNTYANPIILGYTANLGKSVTLLAAPGGTVSFTGGLQGNGTDTTAGVTVGDATHTGVIGLAGANTYLGGTTVNAGSLLVNGSLAAGGAVTVAGGVLGGTGNINGPVTVQSGGTLSPGASIGTLTINSSLTLAGNLLVEINKSLSPSNDLVVVSGELTNAGAGVLTVTNLGPALAAGDAFKLFSKPLPNGGALTLSPAAPGPGLAWANTLDANGTLGVVATFATNPTNLTASLSNGNLTVSWPADHVGWTLQAQTNAPGLGLSTNWVTVSGSALTNQAIMGIDQTDGSVFFRLVYP